MLGGCYYVLKLSYMVEFCGVYLLTTNILSSVLEILLSISTSDSERC